jgi:ATP-dependent DNA helicase PIF1
MITGELFDKLDAIGRALKNSNMPFGGIQVIITGDFFQLPPIAERSKTVKYAFEANSWKTVVTRAVTLTAVYRQTDPVFVNMLNEIRFGKTSPEMIKIFKNLSRKPIYEDMTIESTYLYPLRKQVDNHNNDRLASLPGEERGYIAEDDGEEADRLDHTCTAPKELRLKIGAQVILLFNMSDTLPNGSQGVVIAFRTFTGCKYVSEEAADDDYDDDSDGKGKLYPVVKFLNGCEKVIPPHEWRIELPGGKIVARRKQVPLTLAWALSIHKSQGQTLDRVKVDLGSVFEKGQAYVALSRATSLEGLQVLNFSANKVVADLKVIEFYKGLERISLDDDVEEVQVKRLKTE